MKQSKAKEDRGGVRNYKEARVMSTNVASHYINMPIQIYWKIYHQKMKIFR